MQSAASVERIAIDEWIWHDTSYTIRDHNYKIRNRANDAYLTLHRIVRLVVVANDAILRLHQIVRFASIVHQ